MVYWICVMTHGFLKKENKMEKLSVIVPVYNVYPYLRQCLESIINQTYKNLEIIIVNDASPYIEDDEICKEYTEKDNRIIYVKHEKNKGLGGARNTGIEKATGKYITFVDSDDYIGDNNAYEEVMKIFYHNSDLGMVFFNIKLLEKDKFVATKYLSKEFYNSKIYFDETIRINIPSVTIKIFKCDDIKNNNLYFLEKVKYEDLDFWFKYQMKVKPMIYGIDRAFYIYRQQGDSITHNMQKYVADYYTIFSNMLEEYNKNNDTKYRNLLLFYYSHLKYITPYFQNLNDEEYIQIVNKISLLIKKIKMTEEEFIKYLGIDFYQYLFCDKYIFTSFQKAKKLANKKRFKYLFVKENIIIYKIKREIRRIISKVKGIK